MCIFPISGEPYVQIQQEVHKILANNIVVGHSVHNDFKVKIMIWLNLSQQKPCLYFPQKRISLSTASKTMKVVFLQPSWLIAHENPFQTQYPWPLAHKLPSCNFIYRAVCFWFIPLTLSNVGKILWLKIRSWGRCRTLAKLSIYGRPYLPIKHKH